MFTIEPCDAFSSGMAARVTRYVPSTLTRNSRSEIRRLGLLHPAHHPDAGIVHQDVELRHGGEGGARRPLHR